MTLTGPANVHAAQMESLKGSSGAAGGGVVSLGSAWWTQIGDLCDTFAYSEEDTDLAIDGSKRIHPRPCFARPSFLNCGRSKMSCRFVHGDSCVVDRTVLISAACEFVEH
jgi:hypothetical protein